MTRARPLPSRAWPAIAAATAVTTVSFWSMALGFVVDGTDLSQEPVVEPGNIAGGSLGLSLILVPVVFVAAAFISRHAHVRTAVFVATILALAVGLPLALLGDPLGALIAGVAAGAVQAIARPERTGWRRRAAAAAIVIVLVLIGNRLLPVASFLLAPALPFVAVGLADLTED